MKIECACLDSLMSMEIFLAKQSYDILQSILSVYIHIHLSDIYIYHMIKLHSMNKLYQNKNEYKYVFTIYYNYWSACADPGFFPQRFVLKGESKVSFNEFSKMEVILIRSVTVHGFFFLIIQILLHLNSQHVLKKKNTKGVDNTLNVTLPLNFYLNQCKQ